MLELSFLVISIIIICIVLYYKKDISILNVEPFDNSYLSACPSGYKTYYQTDGTAGCCNGELHGSKCLSDQKCTMGRSTPELENCVSFILKEYKIKGKEFCPITLPSYYENSDLKIKGCTKGNLNPQLNGPATEGQAKCVIYKSSAENNNILDSCLNKRILDMYPCFGNNCSKSYIDFSGRNASIPPLLMVSFSDTSGMHHVSYTKASAERYLDAVWPQWRQGGLNLDKNIIISEVARAFYIDKTMAQSDIQL
jgi:hypothetical protein